MYILLKCEYKEYEGIDTNAIAVSESIASLQSKASEDTKIYDEEWCKHEDDSLSLTIGESSHCYENFYIIKPIQLINK